MTPGKAIAALHQQVCGEEVVKFVFSGREIEITLHPDPEVDVLLFKVGDEKPRALWPELALLFLEHGIRHGDPIPNWKTHEHRWQQNGFWDGRDERGRATNGFKFECYGCGAQVFPRHGVSPWRAEVLPSKGSS